MESELSFDAAVALLDWQVELGASEAICDTPVNRYEMPAKPEKPAAAQPAPAGTTPPQTPSIATTERIAPAPPQPDPVAIARQQAARATTLDELRTIQGNYEHCALKQGARQLVFSDGPPHARLMLLGEAPGRDEDRQGRPFVGRAGQLLDKMLAAIDFGRNHPENPAYITNVIPWRPPQNRDPKPDEIAMMLPFVERHIELVQPDVLVLVGNISCQALLGRKGITRLRGQWAEACGLPVLPMFHPAYLLRNPIAKRDTWADLLSLRARLTSLETK